MNTADRRLRRSARAVLGAREGLGSRGSGEKTTRSPRERRRVLRFCDERGVDGVGGACGPRASAGCRAQSWRSAHSSRTRAFRRRKRGVEPGTRRGKGLEWGVIFSRGRAGHEHATEAEVDCCHGDLACRACPHVARAILVAAQRNDPPAQHPLLSPGLGDRRGVRSLGGSRADAGSPCCCRCRAGTNRWSIPTRCQQHHKVVASREIVRRAPSPAEPSSPVVIHRENAPPRYWSYNCRGVQVSPRRTLCASPPAARTPLPRWAPVPAHLRVGKGIGIGESGRRDSFPGRPGVTARTVRGPPVAHE